MKYDYGTAVAFFGDFGAVPAQTISQLKTALVYNEQAFV